MIQTIEDYRNTINKLRQIVRVWGKADVYLVGGCVRDELLGLVPKDIDLVIDLPGGSEKFIEFLKSTYGPDLCDAYTVFPRFGTSRFSLCIDQGKWIPIECVIPRTEKYEGTTRKPSEVQFGSILEDSRRRDFCCNALYKNVMSSEVLDPTGQGLEDLGRMILRTPLDPEQTFLDDPLRMLRAIRFSCAKGFTIDQGVYEKIKPYQGFYDLSWERIQDELTKIILSPKAIDGIRMLQDRGLLEHILPEVSKTWGMDQKSKYHSLNLTEHTFKVLSGVMVNKYPELSPRRHELELRLAALLHDIGKGQCKIENIDGTCSYYQHEKASANIASDMLRTLKYSNETVDLVSKLILNHMCIKGNYSYTTHEYTGSPQQTRRIAKRLGDDLALEMTLIDADNNAHAPEYCMPSQVKSFWEHYKEDVILFKEPKISKGQPVNGNTIMERLGVSGKAVGDIKHLFDIWYLEDPRLSEEDLIQRYIDWTNGIEIWIARENSEPQAYVVSYNEPLIEEYIVSLPFSSVSVRYLPDIYKENIKLDPGEKIKVSANEHPGLRLALENKRKAEQILHEVGEKLANLDATRDFKDIELSYNYNGDLSARIRWEDGRNEIYV